MHNSIYYFFVALCISALMACSSQQVEPNNTLYQKVGAQQGIERLVDAFVLRIAKDEQIRPYFAKASVSHFKQGFINHFCDVVEGPCKYDGDNMVDIHTGMHINEADFNRVVELLVQAMEDVNIDYQTQNRILAKLAPLRPEIIKM